MAITHHKKDIPPVTVIPGRKEREASKSRCNCATRSRRTDFKNRKPRSIARSILAGTPSTRLQAFRHYCTRPEVIAYANPTPKRQTRGRKSRECKQYGLLPSEIPADYCTKISCLLHPCRKNGAGKLTARIGYFAGQRFNQRRLLLSPSASTVSSSSLPQSAAANWLIETVIPAFGACSTSGTPLLRTSTITR